MSKNYGNDSQISEIVKYISDTMKFPIMGAGGGFAPIGTINFFDASIAPQGWLACDGSTYNIADYPDLATYYASVHGSANFYGGNGTTTFAVPDLRGEFLRGTGTNSHTNQGDGANVGVHQDGTLDNYVFGGDGYLITSNDGLHISNTDHSTKANTDVYIQGISRSSTSDQTMSYTSRPTNTSFLICVKATVSGDANAHQYSTDEQVVGKWFDGRDIFEKTVDCGGLGNATQKSVNHNIENMDFVISIDGTAYVTSTGQTMNPISIGSTANKTYGQFVFVTRDHIQIDGRGGNYSGYNQCYIILRYVKLQQS